MQWYTDIGTHNLSKMHFFHRSLCSHQHLSWSSSDEWLPSCYYYQQFKYQHSFQIYCSLWLQIGEDNPHFSSFTSFIQKLGKFLCGITVHSWWPVGIPNRKTWAFLEFHNADKHTTWHHFTKRWHIQISSHSIGGMHSQKYNTFHMTSEV